MKSLDQLTKESQNATRLLWHSDYWDGPQSGLMLWNNKKCWYKSYKETVEEIPMTDEEIEIEKPFYQDEDWEDDDFINYERKRFFKVYKLSNIQIDTLEYNHNIFYNEVGNHTTYLLDNKREDHVHKHELKSSKSINKYFNKTRKKLDYPKIDLSDSNVIGEFYF